MTPLVSINLSFLSQAVAQLFSDELHQEGRRENTAVSAQ